MNHVAPECCSLGRRELLDGLAQQDRAAILVFECDARGVLAALARVSTGDAPIVLRIEMGAGHGGPTGRYDAWEREAFALAFVIDRLGAPLDPAVSPTS